MRRNLKTAWGEYDPSTNQIVISSKLTNRYIPSYNFIRYHELFHQFVHLRKIRLTPAREESLAYIYSVLKCLPREMSFGDLIIRKRLNLLRRRRLINFDLIFSLYDEGSLNEYI